MPKKRKTPRMTKVIPVKMSDDLYAQLRKVADKVGENESTIIRLVLRAGLRQIESDQYQLVKFEAGFSEAGGQIDAPVDGPSSPSRVRGSAGARKVSSSRLKEISTESPEK